MAPLDGKHTTKVRICHIEIVFFANRTVLPCCQSRASDDNVWVHDRAPGAPRTATQSYELNAQPSSKLIVTNLHYEITPKDLTVYFSILSLHSRVMTFVHIEAIFGQIGTLVREPFIRVRKSDYHYLALLS
jgi:THO complex subunit 4